MLALLGFSAVQALALAAFPSAASLPALYVVAILFGLGYGGVLPCYPLIVRQFFPAESAGTKTAIVVGVSTLGMAFGSALGGVALDLTGAYAPAFYTGTLFNLGNIVIVLLLLRRARSTTRLAYA